MPTAVQKAKAQGQEIEFVAVRAEIQAGVVCEIVHLEKAAVGPGDDGLRGHIGFAAQRPEHLIVEADAQFASAEPFAHPFGDRKLEGAVEPSTRGEGRVLARQSDSHECAVEQPVRPSSFGLSCLKKEEGGQRGGQKQGNQTDEESLAAHVQKRK